MRTAPSPEEVLTQAQQEAADDICVCAIEHASRIADETVLSSQGGRDRLLARAAALLAYAYVDFVQRYGSLDAKDLREKVTQGVQIYAPLLTPGGEG